MKPLTNTAVHLLTKEEYDEYMKMFEYVSEGMGFASKAWHEEKGYKIITLKQLKNMNKTLETLEVGDMVKLGDILLTIRAVIFKTEDNTGYALETVGGGLVFYSAKLLKDIGYAHYAELVETETPEYTMEEAIEKMGFNFKIKK